MGRGRKMWILASCLLGSCGPNIDVADDGNASGDSDGLDDPGVQPSAPGSMYSACTAAPMCDPLEFCVFPPGEGGYCSAACTAPGDPSSCATAPGDSAMASCLDIGLDDGREVCALDCADGRQCPDGMRCEAVDTPAGRADVCF